MLDNIRTQIDQSLETFLETIKNEYRLNLVNPVLYESIKEFVLRKGKRIRPALLILCYKGYSKRDKKLSPPIYYASTCIELLHNFMLIHDDIIDRSDLRRGKPTLHKLMRKTVKTADPDKLGYDLSIIAGDIVYALAIDAFLSLHETPSRRDKALKYFIQTAVLTAMGEFVDTLHGVQKLHQVKEDDVFLNYTLKTARYTFDCPMVVGAILAGAPKKDTTRLSELGLLIGQAFQIQDDIIGIYDSEKNIGKSILSDLAESKKTLLVCHAFGQLQGQQKKAFTRFFMKPRKTYADLVTVRKLFLKTGSLDYSLKQIKTRLHKSQQLLSLLTIKPEYCTEIHNLFRQLFHPCQKIAAKHGIEIVL